MFITVVILISLFAGALILDLLSDAASRRSAGVDNHEEDGTHTKQRSV